MTFRALRYLTDVAGNIKRLYLAVKIADEEQMDVISSLQESFIEKFGKDEKLTSPRSAEPHFALARQLHLLGQGDKWIPTFSTGRAFLKLWEEGYQPPKFLLLAELIRWDKNFIIPFLRKLLNNYTWLQGRASIKIAQKIVQEVWHDLWKKYPQTLASWDPPMPNPIDPRTCMHHALVRLRFLGLWPRRVPSYGLDFRETVLRRIAFEFDDTSKFPDDYYFRIGRAVTGQTPSRPDDEEFMEYLHYAFKIMKGFTYCSALGAFVFINEKILPQKAIDWQWFKNFIKTRRDLFSIQPSYSPDDILFKFIEKRVDINGKS